MAEFNDADRKFLTAMREAVIERGRDYIYDPRETGDMGNSYSCTYLNYQSATFSPDYDSEPVPDDVDSLPPSCIVGCAAVNSGLMDKATLFGVEGQAAGTVLSPTDLSIEVGGAANQAQVIQDYSKPWGLAYDECLNYLSDKGYDVKEFRL